MPRYNYECDNCGIIITVFHGFEETYTDCDACDNNNTKKKRLSVPFIIKNNSVETHNGKIGDLTKEYIEANREILKQQKEEVEKENYEPT